jgi:hypothetical protein
VHGTVPECLRLREFGCTSPARSHFFAVSQVTKLLPAGPAAESGNVEEGDLLQAVDGVDVRTWPLKKLANEKVPPFVLPVESWRHRAALAPITQTQPTLSTNQARVFL